MSSMDKRVFRRVTCEIIASFKKPDGEDLHTPVETTVRDISEGGIRFRSNQCIPIHHCISMRLNLSKTTFIEVSIKPAWIRKLAHVEQYEVAASFIALSKENKTKLHRYFTWGSR